MEIKQLIQRQKLERVMRVHKEMRGLNLYREQSSDYKYHNPYDDRIFRQLADIDTRTNIPNTSPELDFDEMDFDEYMVSAKYCYATHELRLHQNDRCKRFTLF